MEVENEHSGNRIDLNCEEDEHDLIHSSVDKEKSNVVNNSSNDDTYHNIVTHKNHDLALSRTVDVSEGISKISTEETIAKDGEIRETETFDDSEIIETENDTEEISGVEDGEINENIDKNPDKIVQRLTRLPVSRIKSIMKFDDDVHMATQEAIFLVTKATELFINSFMKDIYQCTLASKKKTISKRDVDSAIFSKDCFMFLDGALD